VQDHRDTESGEKAPGLPGPPACAYGGEQCGGSEPGPGHVPGGAQQAPLQQQVGGVRDVAAGLRELDEGVAHRFECGEPRAAGDADQQPVGHAAEGEQVGQGQRDQQLAAFLDDSDAEQGQSAVALDRLELEGADNRSSTQWRNKVWHSSR